MMRAHRLWLLVPVLWLSGCLLPQPDTPIIPPVHPGPMGAPIQTPPETARQTTPEQGGMMAEPGAAAAGSEDSQLAMAAIQGTVSGLAVSRLVAVPEYEYTGPTMEAPVEEGAFALKLPVGDYKLNLVTADSSTLRIDRVISLEPGVTRQLKIEVKQDPRSATITEDVPLEEVPADPAASNAPANPPAG